MEQRWHQQSKIEQNIHQSRYSWEEKRSPAPGSQAPRENAQPLGPWQESSNPEIYHPEMSVDDWIAENLTTSHPPETFYRALSQQLQHCDEGEQLAQVL